MGWFESRFYTKSSQKENGAPSATIWIKDKRDKKKKQEGGKVLHFYLKIKIKNENSSIPGSPFWKDEENKG